LLPEILASEDVTFRIGPREYRAKNAVVCMGQCVDFPARDFDYVYILAASVGGDARGVFEVDSRRVELLVPDYSKPVGQWDDRIVHGVYTEDIKRMEPAFVKPCSVAWTASHRHSRRSNADEAYQRCCLFKLGIPMHRGARRLTLPRNDRIRVFAVTLARGGSCADPAIDLRDWLL
jgi:hypothetical protein